MIKTEFLATTKINLKSAILERIVSKIKSLKVKVWNIPAVLRAFRLPLFNRIAKVMLIVLWNAPTRQTVSLMTEKLIELFERSVNLSNIWLTKFWKTEQKRNFYLFNLSSVNWSKCFHFYWKSIKQFFQTTNYFWELEN